MQNVYRSARAKQEPPRAIILSSFADNLENVKIGAARKDGRELYRAELNGLDNYYQETILKTNGNPELYSHLAKNLQNWNKFDKDLV